jgi:hypothetical protein
VGVAPFYRCGMVGGGGKWQLTSNEGQITVIKSQPLLRVGDTGLPS